MGTEGGSGAAGESPPVPPKWRPDLFLQLPFDKGVLLPGILRGVPQVPLLPPAPSLPPLAIVPAPGGGRAECVPFDGGLDGEAALAFLRRLSPGPLRPVTAAGRALQRVLKVAPERYPLMRDYELLRVALAGTSAARSIREEAEALLLCVYARFAEHGGAPPRPSCADAAVYDLFTRTFDGAAMKAVESTTSMDFQLIAKAHVLGLVQSDEGFPRLPVARARALYSNALRFGHALRQAETRFQADGAAGTFVPLPLEAQLLREELEETWKKSAHDEAARRTGGTELQEVALLSREGTGGADACEDDAEAAQRSLQEVLARLRRIGEARPALSTYLGWLGRFDPEALSMLATPAPGVALAMQLQLDALWGAEKGGEGEDLDSAETVAMTPSDMIEAVLFGAWLRDAVVAEEEALCRHRQPGCDEDDE